MLTNIWKKRQLAARVKSTPLSGVPTNFSYQIQSVGVLLELQDIDQIQQVRNEIQSLGISIDHIEFLVQDKKSAKTLDQPQNYFNWNAFDKSGRCVKDQVVDFVNKPFDLLISLYNQDYLPLQWVTACSKAKCKVGLLYKDSSLNHFDIKLDQVNGKKIR